jgi:Asp-tRNA(Asn)/Glu-tRNA(Gln) amidotransferase C subunit
MVEVTPEATAELAAAAGFSVPPERLAVVAEALEEVLTLAETLEALPLEGVAPVLATSA